MIHYQTYTAVEADKLVELWNKSIGPDFPMDQRLWHQNVDCCSRTFPDASIVAVRDGHIVGAIIGKNPSNVSAIFVAPGYRRRGIATELLARAEVAFAGELETKLIVGQDDRHFFPGVPEQFDDAKSFFAARGFAASEGLTSDLNRMLTDWKAVPTPADVTHNLNIRSIELMPCTVDLIPSLLGHIEANYSERWLRDTRSRLAAEPCPGEVMVAVEDGTSVVGFCHTFSTRSVVVGPSIYWRCLIGEKYGGLGPIGVAKNRRKIGLGLELLNFSITKVAESGADQMVIDWTNLVDFYSKAGFTVWKSYRTFTKTY